MKLFLAAFVLVAAAQSQAAEIRFYENFAKDGIKNKVSSTTQKPLSGKHLLVETNGICYTGSPKEVVALARTMVDLHNAEVPASREGEISDIQSSTAEEGNVTIIKLELTVPSPESVVTMQWPRIAPCAQ